MDGVFRNKTKKLSLVVGLVSALMAVSPGWAASADRYDTIHSIAIVSHLGKVFSFEQSGLTVFDNHLQHADIADWGLDTYAAQKLADILKRRFTVSILPFDSTLLDDCVDAFSCARNLPKNPVIDAYVLIYRSDSRGFGAPGQAFHGVGLFRVPGIFGSGKAVLHVIYGIAVIDAKTGSVIDWSGGQLSKSYFGDHPPPVQDMSADIWPETVPNLADTQVQTINTSIRQLLDDSLQSTAEDLGLVR